jgi:hypothetical protein
MRITPRIFQPEPSPRAALVRAHGFSTLGLTWALCCLMIAGLLWAKASSMDAPAPAATVQAVSSTGFHTKNIEDVRAGEKVWAYDTATDQWKAEPVIKPLVHEYAGDMVAVTVAGQTINATGNHPFWVAGGANLFDRVQAKDVYPSDRASAVATGNGRWIEARRLQPGDLLVLRNGSRVAISEVQVSYARQKVYNLKVAELHTYAVSDVGVAVHNKPCFPPGTLILMGDGSVKPIERIELGDQVLTGDPLSAGPPKPAKVIGIIRTPEGTTATITPTRFHPFWTNNRGWVEAKDLKPDDLLCDSSGNQMPIERVTLRPQISRTFNLEVANVHTYYAMASDRTPVLVHNSMSIFSPENPDPIIYRSMTPGGDGNPVVGESARNLGVRFGTDITPDPETGLVCPNTGGMSVAPDPYALAPFRKPPEFGGTGRDPVWSMPSSDLPDGLTLNPDTPFHGTIQPSYPMTPEEFSGLLAGTSESWTPVAPS